MDQAWNIDKEVLNLHIIKDTFKFILQINLN